MPAIIPSPSWSDAELSAADIASLPYSKWIQEDHARSLNALSFKGKIRLTSHHVRLGKGSCSFVLPGEINQDGSVTQVAVKVYQTGKSDAQMVAREIKVLRMLKHPNIVHFHGVVATAASAGATQFRIVTGLCDGGDILTYLARNQNAHRMSLIHDMVVGMSYLHDNNVVHGRIEPKKVLIRFVNGRACAVISSFASARILGDITSSDWHDGLYIYSPPEHSPSKSLRPRVTKEADVYAFGFTALEILDTMESTYSTEEAKNTCAAFFWAGNRPSREAHAGPELTIEMWRLIEACWNAEPKDRPIVGEVVARVAGLAHK
ncbi:Protein kinase-like domain superfamily protein [Pleurotus pulmonarius]